MSLDRYLKDEHGFRHYVELMENMPTAKRVAMMDAAKKENAAFVEAAEKYLLTFDRVCHLPELELPEVLGVPGLKSELIAIAIVSIEDASLRERVLKLVPRNRLPAVAQDMKDNPEPKPFDVSAARLQLIRTARECEKQGKLESMLIPHFEPAHFRKKAA